LEVAILDPCPDPCRVFCSPAIYIAHRLVCQLRNLPFSFVLILCAACTSKAQHHEDIYLLHLLTQLPLHTKSITMAKEKSAALAKFESVFPKLVEDILDHAKSHKLPDDFVAWYKAVHYPPADLLSFVDQIPLSSPSMPTQSAENAIAACLFLTPSPSSSKSHSPKSNTSRPLHWDG